MPELGVDSISFSQASQKCGYALRYQRERAPRGPASISLLVGRAVHAGIEHHLAFGDQAQEADGDGTVRRIDAMERAVLVAHHEFDHELEREGGTDVVLWDAPHRLTREGEVYRADRGHIPTYEYALRVIGMEVMAWCARFPELRGRSFERRVRVTISERWVFTGYLDVEMLDGGIVDVKAARTAWEVDGKDRDKLEQAQLYMYARLLEDGAPPPYFVFHLIPHAALELMVLEDDELGREVVPVAYDPAAIQIVPVEYDEAAIERILAHRLAPTIRVIESGAYMPNTAGWWHDPRWCAYWQQCPMGAVAHPALEPRP